MTPRSDAGDALRLRCQEIVNRPKRLFGWSLTKQIPGPIAWQKSVKQSVQDWRLFVESQPRIMTAEAEIFRSGLSEILAIQIEERMAAVFDPLNRIEWQLKAVADLRREPWAQSTHPVNR